MQKFEYVPVFMVYINMQDSILFVKDGLKGTTTDTEEAHCFLHENAAHKYIEMLEEKEPGIMAHSLRVHINVDTVKSKNYHSVLDKRLLAVWDKIKTRVWK